MADYEDIDEVLPSGESVPMEKMDLVGPEQDFDVDEANVADLCTYALAFGQQSVVEFEENQGSSLSEWVAVLDIDRLLTHSSVISEAVQDISSRDVEDSAEFHVEGMPNAVKTNTVLLLHSLLSEVVLKAYLDGRIDEISRDALVTLAQYHVPNFRFAPRIYGVVFLASDHPEFPTDVVLSNPALYTESPASDYPYEYELLTLLWHVDADLFDEVFETITSATSEEFFKMGYVTPERQDVIDGDLGVNGYVDHCISSVLAHVLACEGTLPYIFSGDPSGEITQRVGETLPEKSRADYEELIETTRAAHSRDRFPKTVRDIVDEFVSDDS